VQEEPATVVTPVGSGIHADEVARRTFATVRRGFDPREVHDFLQRVSRELERHEEREAELRRRLADAEHRAAHPKLDETVLTSALGEETARVLKSAYDAAHEVKANAEGESARILAEAADQAGRLRVEAESLLARRTAEAEESAAATRREAEDDAERARSAARADAEGILEGARRQGRAMVEEAYQLRSRVLGDLSRRRRALQEQLERLRVGRESLLEAIRLARVSIERIDQSLRPPEPAAAEPEPAGPEPEPAAAEPVLAAQPRGEAAQHPVSGEPAQLSEPAQAPEPAPAVAEPARADERAPEAVGTRSPDGLSGEAHGAAGAGGEEAVGQLFARIKAARAERAETAGQADQTPAQVREGAEEARPAAGGEEPGAASDEEPAPADDPDQELFDQRDAVVGPLAQRLASRLKRALQDEQNALLDQLRRQAGRGATEVLPPEADQRERFRQVGLDVLRDTERAGAALWAGRPAAVATMSGLGDAGGGSEGPPDGVIGAGEREASALAAEVAGALRLRLEERLSGQDRSDHAAAMEAVGATYREWRGSRAERTAMDHVLGAFSAGVLAGAPEGTSLRWVSRDEDGECVDCDDNALAGALPPGEPFPTGQTHPPAHSGCRCLLAPSP
jgi:DivIVA domain-containing protein